jgi:hypothetical protein
MAGQQASCLHGVRKGAKRRGVVTVLGLQLAGNSMVEIPLGSSAKHELEKEMGLIKDGPRQQIVFLHHLDVVVVPVVVIQ